MTMARPTLLQRWMRLSAEWLPFADVATKDLPLSRLLRLSLFQLSVGMAAVLLTGTLNRVMIVELNIPAWIVAVMVSIPLLAAPLRALIGHKSDQHRSAFGWRRVPYIWFGSLMQYGGFAFMPFAIIIMSGDTTGVPELGIAAAALAFLLVGLGMHMTQTAGLALATDIAAEEDRPRVVALLYVVLLVGMLVSSIFIGALLADFGKVKLVQIIQGVAGLTLVLNVVALWKQEARNSAVIQSRRQSMSFGESWAAYTKEPHVMRLLVALGLGTAAFSMQDVLLEPFGGQVLGLSVGQTTGLTALWAAGALVGFALAAKYMGAGSTPLRFAGLGAVTGIFAFALVVWSAAAGSVSLFCIGVCGIGFGSGIFSVSMLVAAMGLGSESNAGLALGAWGAVQATATGVAAAVGGAVRDGIGGMAMSGSLGEALQSNATGYSFVYHLEIALLFTALVALGPLARRVTNGSAGNAPGFGLSEFPT
jgi:MFS transporter, BCD family, chlorophyll transporter